MADTIGSRCLDPPSAITQMPSSSGQAACRSRETPSRKDEAPMKSVLATFSEELLLESELADPVMKQ